MNDTFSDVDLCQRIVKKCQQQHWYGPDMYIPTRLQKDLQEGSTWFWYDRNQQQYPINQHSDIHAIPTASTFEYASITEEQFQSVEQAFGFPLPPLLHAIYTSIADGGFGPGYGLYHVNWMLDEYFIMRRKYRTIDFSLFEKRYIEAKLILVPDYVWPSGFLCLCHWGCAIYSYFDINTGSIFREEYYGDGKYCFEFEATSLTEWFELWLIKGIKMFELSDKKSHEKGK